MSLRVIDIVEGTSVDGPGLRTSIYFAGCSHRCPECHNPSTWDFNAGTETSVDEIMKTVDYNGLNVTFTGGDPLYSAEALLPLARRIRQSGLKIWLYTGFTLEEILDGKAPEGARELLGSLEVIVDGPYVAALRDEKLRFRGSSNQRIIDIERTLAEGSIVLHPAMAHEAPPF